MKILVATDGSRAAAAALRFASKIAVHDRTSELIVLTVYSRVETKGVADDGATRREKAERFLREAARVTARCGRPRARFELVCVSGGDHVPEAISRQANRMRVDLVVVGSEGRESLTEWVVGGTALRLIYIARRPVTVVRAPRRRLPN